MPVLPLPTVDSLGSVSNAWALVQYCMQRVPGFDQREYLRELNASYVHVWEEIIKLRVYYFANRKVISVVNPQYTYDFMYNYDNALSAPVSPRMYQILRLRIQPPAGGLYQTTKSMDFNRPDFNALEANPNSTPTQTGPYYWVPSGRGEVTWALPLGAGTNIEVIYNFWLLQMSYLSTGTVSSVGTAVTGTGTAFTTLLQPDFQQFLPTSGGGLPEEIQAELVVNGQIYRVVKITDDTHLTLGTAPATPFSANAYALAIVPDIQREHIRVIASRAIKNLYSLLGDDDRVEEWQAISEENMQMMKDTLMERQGQDPPQRQRFPYGIGRRNRTFMR